MLSRHADPIIAIATAPGRGAVGVIRISGKALADWVQAVCGRELRPREATLVSFLDAQGQPIDQGLALYFPAPHSYTGEDVLELQVHGGPVVLQLLLARCLQVGMQQRVGGGIPLLQGLRLAQPGEFTERAFLNDKIDLAQAEAIADLIDASTEAAARSASRSLAGAFSEEIHVLRDALARLRMLVEVTLDFPEEEIDFLRKADADGQLLNLQQTLSLVMQRTQQGALLREGIKLVIAGQPNAGKSSLLNALAGAELAIVTPVAGTTRDKVQQTIQIEGVPLHVVDTAGLRDSNDEVERIGIARAWDEIASADAVLFVHDLSRSDATEYIASEEDIESAIAQRVPKSVPIIDIWNKADCVHAVVASKQTMRPAVRLSARTGDGLERLRSTLLEVVGWRSAPEGLYLARARHVQALQEVQRHLCEAAVQWEASNPALDLLAEELRLAHNALGTITGQFSSDDLLGMIFASFCIGK